MNDSSFMNYLSMVTGTAFLLAGIYALKMSLASRHWPSVPGRIRKSKVEKVGLRRPYQYVAQVFYRYKVQGAFYEARTIGAEKVGPKRSTAEKVVQKYRPGTEVVVYYDPKKPSRAVLVPGWNSAVLVILFAGLVFVVVGVVFKSDGWRQ